MSRCHVFKKEMSSSIDKLRKSNILDHKYEYREPVVLNHFVFHIDRNYSIQVHGESNIYSIVNVLPKEAYWMTQKIPHSLSLVNNFRPASHWSRRDFSRYFTSLTYCTCKLCPRKVFPEYEKNNLRLKCG